MSGHNGIIKFDLDSSPAFPDSLPPLLLVGDRECAEEIRDHEVCHPRDAHRKKHLEIFGDLVRR